MNCFTLFYAFVGEFLGWFWAFEVLAEEIKIHKIPQKKNRQEFMRIKQNNFVIYIIKMKLSLSYSQNNLWIFERYHPQSIAFPSTHRFVRILFFNSPN